MTVEDEEFLTDCLVRWEDAWDQGTDLSPHELLGERSDLLPQFQERVEDLKRTAWMKEDPAASQFSPLTQPILSGTVADRYQIEKLIGEGSHGQVYKAFDQELQRQVALKLPASSLTSNDFLEEARKVAQLDHPNIVKVFDVIRHDDHVVIVSELISGETLADKIEHELLSLSAKLKIVADVANAVHHANQRGYVHRDIKPTNILIDDTGKPMVTDFGIAEVINGQRIADSPTSGTLGYMAPEQVAGETQLIGPATDIYSLGVVLYQLLTGSSPYPARTLMALREQVLFRSPKLDDAEYLQTPEAVRRIVNRCLAKHPADRFETAQELADAIENAGRKKSILPAMRFAVLLMATIGIVGLASFFVWNLSMSSDSLLVDNGELVLDGRTRIVTQVDRTLPVTLEAWINPSINHNDRCQFVIGSDVPKHFGVGIGVCGSLLSAEYVGGMLNTDSSVRPGKWTHVAAVFTSEETRIYLDGQLVGTGPGSTSGESSRFVIGNVGESNYQDFFSGRLRNARISRAEIYTDSFHPATSLTADTDTVLLVKECRQHGQELLNAEDQVVGRVERF